MRIYKKLESIKFSAQLDDTIVKIFNRAKNIKEPLSVIAVAGAIHTLSGLREKIEQKALKACDITMSISDAMDDLKLVDKAHRSLANEWITWLYDLKTDYFVVLTEEV